MNCRQVRESLLAYLDDEATSDEQQIRSHLEDCPQCREELGHLVDVRQGLRRAFGLITAEIFPSPQAWIGIKQRLAAGKQPRVTTWDRVISKLKQVPELIWGNTMSLFPLGYPSEHRTPLDGR